METGSNSTTFHISGLKPFKTYLFKVAAKNALGYSQLSNESYPTQTHREGKKDGMLEATFKGTAVMSTEGQLK